ncbi:MAG: hypothetical protein RBG13Loki_0917 [Promethearchaeota archaeon CR_4]|nr:MAG: hypothetical protein RBG13Loki_0917 [Candidatus Lokiarchaeota archaeon CR_4]
MTRTEDPPLSVAVDAYARDHAPTNFAQQVRDGEMIIVDQTGREARVLPRVLVRSEVRDAVGLLVWLVNQGRIVGCAVEEAINLHVAGYTHIHESAESVRFWSISLNVHVHVEERPLEEDMNTHKTREHLCPRPNAIILVHAGTPAEMKVRPIFETFQIHAFGLFEGDGGIILREPLPCIIKGGRDFPEDFLLLPENARLTRGVVRGDNQVPVGNVHTKAPWTRDFPIENTNMI